MNELNNILSFEDRLKHLENQLKLLREEYNKLQEDPIKKYRKETVRIALPPKSIPDRVFTGEAKDTVVLNGVPYTLGYDDAEYEKMYNTPCSTRSSDDNIKGMKAAREFDLLENE